jgi:hypothetical protein
MPDTEELDACTVYRRDSSRWDKEESPRAVQATVSLLTLETAPEWSSSEATSSPGSKT